MMACFFASRFTCKCLVLATVNTTAGIHLFHWNVNMYRTRDEGFYRATLCTARSL